MAVSILGLNNVCDHPIAHNIGHYCILYVCMLVLSTNSYEICVLSNRNKYSIGHKALMNMLVLPIPYSSICLPIVINYLLCTSIQVMEFLRDVSRLDNISTLNWQLTFGWPFRLWRKECWIFYTIIIPFETYAKLVLG